MKKLENNWKYKTLENLERDHWAAEPVYDSYLVKRVTALRKVPLNEFSVEDMRIVIRQEISLNYLIPLAIEALSANLFAEGDMYEGGLLQNVLRVKGAFWTANMSYWSVVNDLIKDKLAEIEEYEIDTSAFIMIAT